MFNCRICDCICDKSDLQNCVCYDCRYEQYRETTKKQELQKLVMAEFKQIRLEDILNENIN